MSGGIRFLTLNHVLALHADAIQEYGGDPGIRDVGLLESAIAQPRAMYGGEYLHPDLPEMAAAYLFHLAKNHAFVDGNKRIAAYVAGVFLDLNGYELNCSEAEFEAIVLCVVRSECEKSEVATFIRDHMNAI